MINDCLASRAVRLRRCEPIQYYLTHTCNGLWSLWKYVYSTPPEKLLGNSFNNASEPIRKYFFCNLLILKNCKIPVAYHYCTLLSACSIVWFFKLFCLILFLVSSLVLYFTCVTNMLDQLRDFKKLKDILLNERNI